MEAQVAIDNLKNDLNAANQKLNEKSSECLNLAFHCLVQLGINIFTIFSGEVCIFFTICFNPYQFGGFGTVMLVRIISM